ncbi:MAG: SHOCT domain-containing protein [Syntrophales bacterium]|jgi:putative membrane protein|nr:SHOCT domain-containing protein [Syntrophales bacterium]MDY0043819.1 SHOCT domain-containing protein [Syntrophales bacterium]
MRCLNFLLINTGTALFLTCLFFAGETYAQGGRYGDWHGMMDGWGMGWFGGIIMILFWILVIAGLILFVKWLVQNTKGGSQADSRDPSRALDILRERYARGEINKQEFDEKKKDLLS